jgi:hypothetical protein
VVHVLAEPALGDAGQRGYLTLGHLGPVAAERFDHEAEVLLTACVKHVRACADSLHDSPNLGQGQSHGALPVPLVARLTE